MRNSSFLFSCFFFSFVYVSSSSLLAEAKVPLSKSFKYSLKDFYLFQGSMFRFSDVLVEDAVDYSSILRNYPFSLCFYNATPNAYFLGLGMGFGAYNDLMHWVWKAKLTRPVTENAKFIFGSNGNLVLVDANGRVAWQTRTANKGVVDLKLLPNGNLVLLDKTGRFVWQSFDHPTDTLLVGQSLFRGSSDNSKLVSGAYSMVLDDVGVNLLFKSPHSSKPLHYNTLVYASSYDDGHNVSPLKRVKFDVATEVEAPEHANELRFDTTTNHVRRNVWAQPKYNSTLSMLRLSPDGNIHVYTYYKKGLLDAWEETFTLFTVKDWDNSGTDKCSLPETCGSLGICKNSQCVACPTPNGVRGWSEDCKQSKIPSCNGRSTGAAAANVSYYKIEGVDHFLNTYLSGERPVNIKDCRKKCTNDCKCVAFFYLELSKSCLLTVQLNTLTKNPDSEGAPVVAYIKYTK